MNRASEIADHRIKVDRTILRHVLRGRNRDSAGIDVEMRKYRKYSDHLGAACKDDAWTRRCHAAD